MFLLGSLATALIGAAATFAAFIYYPYYRTHESKTRLEDGLIYSLSYMTVLSASGMPIERILDRISEVEDNPPLVHISKKFLMDIRLFGMDVRTALRDIITISPSKALVKQIESIRTTIATSGDLKTLLQN
jgi:flagellar protein FlaJ